MFSARPSWTASATTGAPDLIRLASGSLLLFADRPRAGAEGPEGIEGDGPFLAISDDDGGTWSFRSLPGIEAASISAGGSVLRQAPDGAIHLVTTTTLPALHLEFNEAWVRRGGDPADLTLPAEPGIVTSKGVQHRFPDGSMCVALTVTTDDGRLLLHGPMLLRSPNGLDLYSTNFLFGRHYGTEIRNGFEGQPLDVRVHEIEEGSGVATFKRAAPGYDGSMTLSSWRDMVADGHEDLLPGPARE